MRCTVLPARYLRSACLLSVLIGLPLNLLSAAETPGLKPGERIVFLGDSITAGGVRPDGYVTRIQEAIAKEHPELGVEIIGAGISGNKVPDCQQRLERDVLAKQPTRVVIYIGINDVWHWNRDAGTPQEAYEAGLRDLIQRCQQAGAKVLLCTPSVIGERTDGSNKFDSMLEEYAAISRQVAAEAGARLVDLRKAFLEHLKQNNPENAERGILTTDGVHLNAAGNRLVAERLLAALTAAEGGGKLLRHIVMFQFKDTTTAQQVQEIERAFAALPGKIPAIADFEYGTDVSVEDRAQGYTHCFLVTFRDEAGRAEYLPHPAHQAFVTLVGPHVQQVLVFDYWAAE